MNLRSIAGASLARERVAVGGGAGKPVAEPERPVAERPVAERPSAQEVSAI